MMSKLSIVLFAVLLVSEAFAIYSNGSKEMDKLRMQVFQAKTMEVTKKVKTHSGTIIECSVDMALMAAAIADKTSGNLDELYERATRGKGRV